MSFVFQGPAWNPHASQFITVNGALIRGGCTLMSLAAADMLSKSDGAVVVPGAKADSATNLQEIMRRIYLDARAAGNCQPNGAARAVDMVNEAKRISLPVKATIPYTEPLAPAVWIPFLRKYCSGKDAAGNPARVYPTLIQFANGKALNDAFGGGADQWDLKYHAATCYGTVTDSAQPGAGGYRFCDGDNPAINTRPVAYNLPTLIAARPIAFIVFDYVMPAVKPTPAPPAAGGLTATQYAALEAQLAAALAQLQTVDAALKAAQH